MSVTWARLWAWSRWRVRWLRNRVAWHLTTAALRIATPPYRGLLRGTARYGLTLANQDARADQGNA